LGQPDGSAAVDIAVLNSAQSRFALSTVCIFREVVICCVETVAGDGELFISLVPPIVTFEIIQDNARFSLSTKDYKLHITKRRVYCGNIEIIAISEIYKACVSLHYISEGHSLIYRLLQLVKL
jgi:hypothetical protein